jgi:prepilin-type N-terminal cleavage/methylation domain-containing protein
MTIKTNQGFTLIEVIVTIAIIAMLAAILIPSFIGLVETSDEKRAIMECQNTVKVAQLLYIDHFDNPDSVTKAYIKEKAKLNGELISYEQTGGTITHLQITTVKWTVTYCKDWETCSQHTKLYTTTKTNNQMDPEITNTHFYIGNTTQYKVNSDGDLATYDFGPYGSIVPQGTIFYWEGSFYYTRNNQYLTNSTDKANYINNYGIRIDNSQLIEPGSNTQPGQLKQTTTGIYVFFPYSRFNGDYAEQNYWFQVDID